MDDSYGSDKYLPNEPRYGRPDYQVPPYKRQNPNYPPNPQNPHHYQQQPPANYPRQWQAPPFDQDGYNQDPMRANLPWNNLQGRGMQSPSQPPFTPEDQKIISDTRRKVFWRLTLPAMSGTWFCIYFTKRYIAPTVKNLQIGLPASVGISLVVYLSCVYKSGKECVKAIANNSTSAYGDHVRNLISQRYPKFQFTPPQKYGFPLSEESSFDSSDFVQPQAASSSPPSYYADPFNQPMSSRLKRRTAPQTGFSDTGSEFVPEDKPVYDTGFRTPQGMKEEDDEAPPTAPRMTTSYDELRMRNRSGLKF